MSRFASKDPVPLAEIAFVDQETINQIVSQIEVPAANWGNIGGTLSDQSDLNSALSGKEPASVSIQSHVSSDHAPSDAVSLSTVKSDYDVAGVIADRHSHSNIALLENTTEALTTALKADYDTAHSHSQAIHAPTNAQPNNISDVNASLLTGGQEITLHSHAGGPGGVSPLYIHLNIPILAALAWTNMPAALSFWLSTATVAKGVLRVDLTGYTQVRLLVNKQGVAGAAASKLILRYKVAPFTQAVANYSDIGTTEVSVATNVLNTFLDTGWKDLVAGAKADIFLALLGSGGDGALDPAFGMITAVFK